MINSKYGKYALIKSFIGSNIVSLGAGTPYIYSYYAPRLLEQCNIPISKSSSISFSLNIGSSLLAMFAGMIIDYNPAISCLVGAITTCLAYGILHFCYHNSVSNVFLVSLALIFAGFGSISGFFAGVKVCTTNFPKHRGTATAFPIAMYALSGMIFSTLCAKLYGDNMLGVFRFLQITCTAMILVGIFTLKVLNDPSDEENITNNSFNDTERNSRRFNDIYPNGTPLESSTSVDQTPQEYDRLKNDHINGHNRSRSDVNHGDWQQEGNVGNNFQGSPEISLSQREGSEENNVSQRNSTSFGARQTNLGNINTNDDLLETPSNQSDLRSPRWRINEPTTLIIRLQDNKVIQNITDPRYLVYYVILAIQMGIGQMYIYSVGFLIQVQVNTPPLSEYNLDKSKLQAFQISLFAIFSFCGRLTSGPISDVLVRRLGFQRLWNIFSASFLVLIASHFITITTPLATEDSINNNNIPAIRNISFCTTFFGYAFGIIFGTFPSIIADTFGTEGFSTIWSICTTGGVFTVKLFTSILAHDLSTHSNTDDSTCKLGTKCYKHTFNTIFDICVLGSILTAAMIFGTYWNAQKKLEELQNDVESIQLQLDN
ncbi:hypothetical protein C6P45_001821 [Maudiozyma exigua]|uniref:Nodulin-like domain-containing protein n=1 Tax=Maudiozyma exigua TaxID=34358 RepID=A0A9P6WE25_MAUEX|nr:hypothetical protein C6P45_001821 [Kazachstania exigua]